MARFVAQFRKKPVVVEAIQFDGTEASAEAIRQWMGAAKDDACVQVLDACVELFIQTLEGVMRATNGDYIIRGVSGEHYPCKPDIFAQTYDPVEP